jgi:hypothetical protein
MTNYQPRYLTKSQTIVIKPQGRNGFDAIVENWNAAKPFEKRRRRNECMTNGHDPRNIVQPSGELLYVVCARCCEYFDT